MSVPAEERPIVPVQVLIFEGASLLQHEMRVDVRFGSWSCKNSNARQARRNILEILRIMRTDDPANTRLGAALENCIFYICPMYEFLHSLGP